MKKLLLLSALLLATAAFAKGHENGRPFQQHQDHPSWGHWQRYQPEGGRQYHRLYRDRRADHPEWFFTGQEYRYYYYEPYWVVPPPNCVWFPGVVVCF